MANHGSVAIGATLDKAVENACCSSGWPPSTTALSALGTPRVLTDEEQADVITQAIRRNYGNQ